MLVLDHNLNVLSANTLFYHTFNLSPEKTINQKITTIGQGQWNIPELDNVLQSIIPNQTFITGFKMSGTFPLVGNKIVVLSARQIYYMANTPSSHSPPIVLVAMEDITDIMSIADAVANHTIETTEGFSNQVTELSTKITNLERDMRMLKKKQWAR